MKFPKFALCYLPFCALLVAVGFLFSSSTSVFLRDIHLPPSLFHPFGTDDLGRDLFLLACKGLQTSLFVGFIAGLFDLVIGVPYGAFAGSIRGYKGAWMLRFADILHIVPMVLQVLLFTNIFGPGLFPIIFCFFFSGWTSVARVVATQVRILGKKPFVLYSKMLGASYSHIFFTHLLKNLWPFILPVLHYTIPKAIFIEAFLSFLGMGISPPQISLGMLIAEGMATMEFVPWRLFFPSFLLLATLFSFQQIAYFLQEDLVE